MLTPISMFILLWLTLTLIKGDVRTDERVGVSTDGV